MYNELCQLFDLEVPIFAFSHSPAVVAAVSQAGGFGILGASRFEPDELDRALQWITEECNGKPFGVDLVISPDHVGNSEGGLDQSELQKRIPQSHRDFVEDLLKQHNVPELISEAQSENREVLMAGQGSSYKTAAELVEIALTYPVRLIVNALGLAPAEFVERAHRQNVLVGALVGTVKHAQKQKAAGVDLIIAQGGEAGGHTGEIATMVLVPQVVATVAPIPVLAAGGIATGRQMAAAFALGAQGVWCGSVWLTTLESETLPVIKEKLIQATSSDTLRSRARTGKPARQLRSAWTDAWESPETPDPLPMPLQAFLYTEAQPRIEADAARGGKGGQELINYFAGQVVGMLTEIRPAREVLRGMVAEYNAVIEEMVKRPKM